MFTELAGSERRDVLASVGWLGLLCMRVVSTPEGSSLAGLTAGWLAERRKADPAALGERLVSNFDAILPT